MSADRLFKQFFATIIPARTMTVSVFSLPERLRAGSRRTRRKSLALLQHRPLTSRATSSAKRTPAPL
jgi:hypothetical protein